MAAVAPAVACFAAIERGAAVTSQIAPSNPSAALWDDDPRGQAVRAVEIARTHCTCDDRYHVVWPLLRAAGIKGTLRAGEDAILAPLLARLLRDGTRLLIAGSADTATFATVGRMSGAGRPDFTVLDRCNAPLALIEAFAAARGIACRTVHQDLSALDEDSNWDVVLLHYTFQFIAPDQRGDVIERLARALVPGGALVSVSKDVAPVSRADAPAAASRWLEKTRQRLRAEGFGSVLEGPLYDELLAQAADGRTIRRVTNPSAAELIGHMHRAGLVLTQRHSTPTTQRTDGTTAAAAAELSIVLVATRP